MSVAQLTFDHYVQLTVMLIAHHFLAQVNMCVLLGEETVDGGQLAVSVD